MSEDISKKLRKARIEANFTLDELSKISGISVASLQRYETGSSIPTMDKVQKITKALNVNFDYLLGNASMQLNTEDLTFITYITEYMTIALSYEGIIDSYFFFPPNVLEYDENWENQVIVQNDNIEKVYISPDELLNVRNDIVNYGKYKLIELLKTKNTSHNRAIKDLIHDDIELDFKKPR